MITEELLKGDGEINHGDQLSLFRGSACCVYSCGTLAAANMFFGPDRYWART